MQKTYLNPATLPDWSSLFTQVIVVEKNGLKFIHLSGQVGVDSDKNLVGSGSFQEQTSQAFLNLQAALISAKATASDVVKLVIYVVNYQYEHVTIIKEELHKIFSGNQLPAMSLIGVAALADEKFLIEIDAEAVTEASN